MNDDRSTDGAIADNAAPAPVPAVPQPAMPQLRTVALCDLADSTALVERLGDRRAAELFRRHDRLARDLLQRHRGREIDKTDGFLALFERPINAVAFALDYQRALRDLGAEQRLTLTARVGVHVGDVLLWENAAEDIAQGAKRIEVEGLAKPVAARLMNLARPGQILLSGMTHNLAQRSQHDLGPVAERVRWPTHGRYRFKGVPAPMLVHEVGEVGIAPLKAPPSSTKAQRELPLWRQPRALAVEAIAALGTVLVLVFALTTRPQPAIAFGERDWVVVGDLRNLTGDDSIEDALETAFRISLEQSRFVNVLPDLTLRDALARMQQPGDAAVDRETGSEIALREGARALILPTVADIGGRIRVSAEIVDPHTQTTVYAEAADGIGLESSLASMDKVAAQLRLGLGETLQSIERDSQPLPKVTTGELDALKAYADATSALARSNGEAAEAAFRQALRLDDGFALAHLGLARLLMQEDRKTDAIAHVERATALQERLTPRDRLYAQAWHAAFGPPAPMMEKWKLLAAMYPDYYAGHVNYAQAAWQYGNRFADAEQAVRAGLAQQNPLRAGVHALLGIQLAAQGRSEEALSALSRSVELGFLAAREPQVAALVAARRGDEARLVLERIDAEGGVSDWSRARLQFLLAADAGRIAEAAKVAAARSGGIEALEHRTAMQVLQDSLALAAGDVDALKARIRDRLEMAGEGTPTGSPEHRVYTLLLSGYLAARAGDPALAQQSLDAAAAAGGDHGFPNNLAMGQVLRAEIALATGRDLAAAMSALDELVDGAELFQVRSTRLRVARAQDNLAQALVDAEWLAAERGRAVMEWGSHHAQQALNIIDANLALLDQAEILQEMQRDSDAATRLAAFTQAWTDPPAPVAERVARVVAAQPSSK